MEHQFLCQVKHIIQKLNLCLEKPTALCKQGHKAAAVQLSGCCRAVAFYSSSMGPHQLEERARDRLGVGQGGRELREPLL